MSSTTLLLLTIGIVAWLTAAATAVRSVSRIWLRHWVEQRLSGSGVAALYLERPHNLLLAASTGVALTVFWAGMLLATSAPVSVLAVAGRALAYALLLLVAGQLVPRAVGRRWATQLIPVLLPPLQLLEMMLGPAVLVLVPANTPHLSPWLPISPCHWKPKSAALSPITSTIEARFLTSVILSWLIMGEGLLEAQPVRRRILECALAGENFFPAEPDQVLGQTRQRRYQIRAGEFLPSRLRQQR